MSKYTTELRFIAEMEAGYTESQPFSMINTVMEKARPKIFNFDYPIFDPEYRPTLEYKIMRHYWTQEIGEETYGLWKLRLMTKLNEIMPYYNKIYEADAIKYDILYDTDYFEKRDGTSHFEGSGEDHNSVNTGGEDITKHTGKDTKTVKDTSEGSEGSEADNWQYFNDTPQGGLAGIQSHRYLTNATNNTVDQKRVNESTRDTEDKTVYDSQNKTEYGRTETGDRTNSSDNLTTDDYLNHVYGRRGGRLAPEIIRAYRECLINVDALIIEELEVLFMGLW